MRFQRSISARITQLARHFKVIVLTGARQTGKTTLLTHLFPDHHLVTLDLPQDAAMAEQAPSEFLARHPLPLLVDEVQYAPALFRHLKAAVDAKATRGQVVLTGSQRFVLTKEVSESLAGRAAVLQLLPLSAEELGKTLDDALSKQRLSGVLARGFYPALWDDPELPSIDFHRSYVSTWLERDLRQLLNVGSLRDFERFLRACAARCGQLINKSELARDVGIAVSTAGQWLSALEAAGLIVILEPYFDNHTKRLIKTPKLYFTDVGLVCFLLGLDGESLSSWAGLGALWETAVFGELLKWQQTHRPEATLWFYRDKDGLEVDFVVQVGGEVRLLDAKLTELPEQRDARGLLAAQRVLGKRARKLALVSPGRKPFPLGDGVGVVDGWKLPSWLNQK